MKNLTEVINQFPWNKFATVYETNAKGVKEILLKIIEGNATEKEYIWQEYARTTVQNAQILVRKSRCHRQHRLKYRYRAEFPADIPLSACPKRQIFSDFYNEKAFFIV